MDTQRILPAPIPSNVTVDDHGTGLTLNYRVMILFPLLHVGIGAGLTYYTLAGFLNRTIVEVSHEGLTI